MRLPIPTGGIAVVDIQARGGKVFAHSGGLSIEMEPEVVARLRSILGDAIAVALQERGAW